MLEEKLKAGILKVNTDIGVVQGDLVEKITRLIHNYELDLLLGPEWLFVPKDKLYSRKEKKKIISKIVYDNRDRDTLIIPGSMMWLEGDKFYNSAPIISKGELLGEYYKRSDYGSTTMASSRKVFSRKYSHGHDYGRYSWRDYQIGIEICGDYGDLMRFLMQRDYKLLDLHFLVSCGKRLKYDNPPVKNSCYSLCSDGHRVMSEVLQRKTKEEEKGLQKEYDYEEITPEVKDKHLDIYELLIRKP